LVAAAPAAQPFGLSQARPFGLGRSRPFGLGAAQPFSAAGSVAPSAAHLASAAGLGPGLHLAGSGIGTRIGPSSGAASGSGSDSGAGPGPAGAAPMAKSSAARGASGQPGTLPRGGAIGADGRVVALPDSRNLQTRLRARARDTLAQAAGQLPPAPPGSVLAPPTTAPGAARATPRPAAAPPRAATPRQRAEQIARQKLALPGTVTSTVRPGSAPPAGPAGYPLPPAPGRPPWNPSQTFGYPPPPPAPPSAGPGYRPASPPVPGHPMGTPLGGVVNQPPTRPGATPQPGRPGAPGRVPRRTNTLATFALVASILLWATLPAAGAVLGVLALLNQVSDRRMKGTFRALAAIALSALALVAHARGWS
jgi:hypothetical protein